jgi:hypothetical protein
VPALQPEEAIVTGLLRRVAECVAERAAVALANAAVDYVRRRVLCTERERDLFSLLLRGDLTDPETLVIRRWWSDRPKC